MTLIDLGPSAGSVQPGDIPNRRERRAMGFRGAAFKRTGGDDRPRYVRRNMQAALAPVGSGRSTRRAERKRIARIIRHADRIGLKYGA